MPPNIKQSYEKWQKFCGFKTHGSTNSPMHMVLEGLEPDEAELFKFLGGDI